MNQLPERVVDFLRDRTHSEHRPAYLLLDQDGRVVEHGGLTGTYGLDGLRQGDIASDTFPVLQSLLPVGGEGEVLNAVKTPSGVAVDVWALREGEHTWVILLDVSEQIRRQEHFQQQANEARLLAYRDEGTAGELRALPAVLAALGVAVLARHADGSFGLVGAVPSWFAQLWPGARSSFDPAAQSPFLEHFVTEAEECWRGAGEPLRRSGLWTEVDGTGAEHHLSAWAVRSGDQPMLVLNDATGSYQTQSAVIQRAREQALVHSRLVKEVEKKDVLLHSIVHDLRSPLVSVHSTLQLLTDDTLSERSQQLLQASIRQLERQDNLIKTILDVFAAEAREGEETVRHGAVDILTCARETVEMFTPTFALKKASLLLSVEGPETEPWLVGADRMRLVRVFANLIENALRYSRRGQTVRINLAVDGPTYRAEVEDQGPGVPPERATQIFDRFSQAGRDAGAAGLGLHFCRITLDNWGGTIGQRNRAAGGSCFWFALPRAPSPD